MSEIITCVRIGTLQTQQEYDICQDGWARYDGDLIRDENGFVDMVALTEPPYLRPYTAQERKGVLFRLPWRTDAEAVKRIDNVPYFENASEFPRWNAEEQLGLFKDLKEYIHQAILCCQHLKIIRLIWHDETSFDGYQVKRDFKLSPNICMCFIKSLKGGMNYCLYRRTPEYSYSSNILLVRH